MKKRYFVVLAMLVTFLFAEGEPAGSSGGGDTPAETVKTKEKTEKDKNQEVKDSINKAVKEVQNEKTGNPGTDTLGTESGTGTPNTINGTPGGNGAENGEIPYKYDAV